MRQSIYILLFFSLSITPSLGQTITNNGNTFTPDTLHVNLGDTITFNISSNHNAVEVTENTWNLNGTNSNNGFNIPYGGGNWIVDSIKTYYYVCQPHVNMGMKGVIISSAPPCNKSLTQALVGFNPNPLYSAGTWSFDTLTLTNTSDCDIRLRPEFTISKNNGTISQGDFTLKAFNAVLGILFNIPYSIDGNGNAVGSLGYPPGDTTGLIIQQGAVIPIPIQVKFSGGTQGNYCANWETKEVDTLGNIIQNFAGTTTCLDFVNCNNFSIDSSYSSDITCFNANDGAASILSIQNGSSNYLYNWSNGETTNEITNLSAGNYYCIITDMNWQQCTDSITFLISEPTELIAIPNVFDITCNGMCDGEIISNPSGGTLPYSFSWDGGITWSATNSLDSLCPGNYTLSVADHNGCIENIPAIPIIEANAINLNIDSVSHITTYGGNNGSIYISSNGGTGQLSTSWSSDNGFSSNNEDISNLSAGFYYLEITDINLCTYLDTIELTQPALLWMNLDVATNPSCFDSCNGALNITANGGDSTYTYTWIGPNGFTSTNEDLINLCDGAYIITIDDGIATITDTFNIYQPQAITSNLSIDSIMCHNGFSQAEINVWGGTQPLIYNWSNGDTTYVTAINAGIYSINVTDQNGCSINESFTLTNPDSIISLTTSTNVNCFGGNNGSISVNIISGGTSPYSYLWSNGQNTNTALGLSAGTYSCTITDANGCLDSANADIIEADEIISSTSAIEASCYGNCDGSVLATATGGTPPYSYIWTNGTSNLCAGFYNVTITDANGCSAVNSAIINEPSPLVINIWIDSTSLIATNGFSSYQWYTENGTPIVGATSEVFTPSTTGEYYVLVTDSNNCEEQSYIINYDIIGLDNIHESIKIYPNPTNRFVNISGDNIIHPITIINLQGNELLKVENNNNPMSSTTLDLSTFAKGIYFLQLEKNNQIINYRIVLQ